MKSSFQLYYIVTYYSILQIVQDSGETHFYQKWNIISLIFQ